MKTIKYTLATLMVAAIVAVVLVGCSKEKELTPQQDNRKPIAMRTTSGEIVSLVDCEKLTAQLGASKEYTDKYIVESVEVIDQTTEEPYYFIINLIDVENEKSHSIAYIGDFVEEISNTFYATKDFADGNYGFTDHNGDKHQFVNHNPVDPDPNCTLPGFWIDCTGEGCKNGTCKPKHFHCESCESLDENNPGVCSFSGLGWGTGIIITIATKVVPKILGK